MASVYKDIHLAVSSVIAWDVIRDVGNVHKRLVPGYAQEVALDGSTRILTMWNGNTVKEKILDINEPSMRMAYTVVETAMPLEFHHASFQVFSVDEKNCRLVWITDILPDNELLAVEARVDRGAEIMKQTIEAQGIRKDDRSKV